MISPAKTVADGFEYRSKIGLDVAIEALIEYRRKRGVGRHTRVVRVPRTPSGAARRRIHRSRAVSHLESRGDARPPCARAKYGVS
ncbi:hypothetical protein EON77_10430 [bacterium]|nr:MAG: hypothetical protein EON77_10430 [bacterium]